MRPSSTLSARPTSVRATGGGYSDPLFTGRFEVWKDCRAPSAQYIVLVASQPDSNEVAIVTVQAINDRDFDALDHILDTFSTTDTVLEPSPDTTGG